MVAIVTFWWGWSDEQKARMEVERPRIAMSLTGSDGVLANLTSSSWPPAWRIGGEQFGDAPFTVGAIFEDVVGGVAALRASAEAHYAKIHVRLFEAPDADHDPLLHLRPSTPPVPRFDLVVSDVGSDRSGLVAALFETLKLYEGDARRKLSELPAILALALVEPRAQTIATELRKTGATIVLQRNDG
jgi:hypothetical protein